MEFPNGGVAIMTFGYTYPPYTHGHIKCTNCLAIVARCGCRQGCEEVATIDKCVKCACQTGDGQPRLTSSEG